MSTREPTRELATHDVVNQPPPLEGYDLYASDPALREGLAREGAAWADAHFAQVGKRLGTAHVQKLAWDANRHAPELRSFDRYGHRIDEVEYHPAYHELMALSIASRTPSIAWTAERTGGQVAHAALVYLFSQAEPGVSCPTTMTYAAVPTLRQNAVLAAEWIPRVLSTEYDPRFVPAGEKRGATIGMAMTEKQGGSDVRANTTTASRVGESEVYALHGHKWFCSAPMSDGFLMLAQAPEGLSCFFVPRWTPDGVRNAISIQRLKDKLGNRSNASSEIELRGAFAVRVGEDGRGVATILEMVQHTRLDTVASAAGLMRQALFQAAHHARHRHAFGRALIEQPLMRSVLADLALEVEAAVAFALRLARGFDEAAAGDAASAHFVRLATAVGKYWFNKRSPGHVCEAMECLGGAGYVEESTLPRLYREAPVNSIWEGSGNVICLDVLRAIVREPATLDAYLGEIALARGADARIDRFVALLERDLGRRDDLEARARRLTERMALALCAALLVRDGPAPIADAFCAARLDAEAGRAYGALPDGIDAGALIARAVPNLA